MRGFAFPGCAAIAVLVALAAAALPGATLARGHSSAVANPFTGAKLYIDPYSSAHEQATRWRRTRPGDAAAMDKIAGQPQAAWFGDWNSNVRADVAAEVRAARAAGALPVLVAYDIPKRDCGGYSAGGARSASAYRRWIRSFAAGLGRTRAAVVLEPDALANLDCLSRVGRFKRLGLLSYAVSKLRSGGTVAVYIDAGNQGWKPAPVIALRLRQAGIRRARGFSLNVSNFDTTANETRYGKAISARIGQKPFVIDTSRNGVGPTRDRQWCNPPGRALGTPPTAQTGEALVDALLWVKAPGESDGQCSGGPAAGEWWPAYALGLAQRAPW